MSRESGEGTTTDFCSYESDGSVPPHLCVSDKLL